MDSATFLLVSIANALLITGLAIVHALRATRPPAGQASADAVPTAPVQRLAIASLSSAGILAAAMAFIAWNEGVEAVHTRPVARLLVTMLALCATIAATVPLRIARARADRGTLMLDERDDAILRAAPTMQSWTLLLVLLGGVVLIAERYWSAGAAPLGAVLLLCWGCLVAWAVALPAGVVLGYRGR